MERRKLILKKMKLNTHNSVFLQYIKDILNAAITHDGNFVIRTYEYQISPDHELSIFQEVAEGSSLKTYLYVYGSTNLEPVVVVSLLLQIFSCILYLHKQGIAHGHICLENIMVSNIKRFRIKLCDPGFYKIKLFCETLPGRHYTNDCKQQDPCKLLRPRSAVFADDMMQEALEF